MNEFNEDYRKKKLKKNGEVLKTGDFARKKKLATRLPPGDKTSKKPLKNSAVSISTGNTVGAVLFLKQ